MLTKEQLQQSLTKEYWLSLCPELTITDDLLSQNPEPPYEVDNFTSKTCDGQYKEEGYFHSQPIIPKDTCERLAETIIKVTSLGFPAQFCLVYDEFWKPLRRLNKLLDPVIGKGYLLLPDFWFYNVKNADNDSGWPPHRDLQHPHPVNKDGTPNVINLWIPLTDATTLNGCMYILPATRDPYYPEDFSTDFENDFKDFALDILQSFRALPAKAGSILGWNQLVLHWGSRSSKWASEPRINYSMYVQRADINPYDDLAINLSGDNNFELTFEMRLGLVCRSIWQYRHSDNLNITEELLEYAKNNHALLNGRGYPRKPTSRNDPCWCGSGKRYKHCHGMTD